MTVHEDRQMSKSMMSPKMREEYINVARQFRGTNASAAILGLLKWHGEAEARQAEAENHIRNLLGLVRKAQERLCDYLRPGGSNDDREAMNDILYMFDGPEQRDIEKPARAFLEDK